MNIDINFTIVEWMYLFAITFNLHLQYFFNKFLNLKHYAIEEHKGMLAESFSSQKNNHIKILKRTSQK